MLNILSSWEFKVLARETRFSENGWSGWRGTMNVARWRSPWWPWPSQRALTRVRTRFAWKFYDRPSLRHNSERYALHEPSKSKNLRLRSKHTTTRVDFLFQFGIDYSSISWSTRYLDGRFFSVTLCLDYYIRFCFFVARAKEKMDQSWTLVRSTRNARNIVSFNVPPIFSLISSFFSR